MDEYGKERNHKFMEKNYKVEGTQLIYQMPQEVDHHIAKELCKDLDRLIESQGIGELVLDFSRTEFMDSSGIGLLMGRFKLMRALGGTVYIANAGERIRKVLMLSGIHKIIPIEGEI